MTPGEEQSAWRALGELSTVGMTLVLATVIGLAGGYYLDKWLGTSPWLTLIGLGFGIAAGFVNLFRTVNRAGRDVDDGK
jgi:ATP synthase protein I